MSQAGTIARFLVIALPIYFIWEMLQAPAFTGMPEGWAAATGVCAVATLGDGVIVLGVFGLGALAFGDTRWFVRPRIGRYTAMVLVAIGVQVMVEWVMVYRLQRWNYGPRQPIVPLLGVGILPILQPVVLLPLSLGALARWERWR